MRPLLLLLLMCTVLILVKGCRHVVGIIAKLVGVRCRLIRHVGGLVHIPLLHVHRIVILGEVRGKWRLRRSLEVVVIVVDGERRGGHVHLEVARWWRDPATLLLLVASPLLLALILLLVLRRHPVLLPSHIGRRGCTWCLAANWTAEPKLTAVA